MAKASIAAFAASTALALCPIAAEASNACWKQDEARAAQIRGLQTMLMVGTLQCRGYNLYSVDLYNDFVLRQRPVLDSNSHVLKAHFVRDADDAEGQKAYDRYATSLANRYSAEMDNVDFCQTVDEFVRLAARASPEELMQLAQRVADAPSRGSCEASDQALETADRSFDAPGAQFPHASPLPPRIAVVETAPVPVPAPERAAVPDAKTAVIEKAVNAVEAAAPPEALPAAAPLAAAPASLPQADRETALQNAVTALQAAIEALKAASAPAEQPIVAKADLPLTRIADSPVVPPPPPEKD